MTNFVAIQCKRLRRHQSRKISLLKVLHFSVDFIFESWDLFLRNAINSNVLVSFLFLITELQLLRVCNPLARSAGVFLSLFEGFGGVWTDVVCHFKKSAEIWNIHQAFKVF